MKKLIIVFAALCIASPALAVHDFSNSDWTQPYATDSWTLALYHFDEEQGDTMFMDSSGNAHHGYIPTSGVHTFGWGFDPYFNQVCEPDPNQTWQAGKFGNAATLWFNSISDSNHGPLLVDQTGDTTNTSLVLAEGNDIDGNPRDRRSFTIEWWMKADNAGGGWGSRIIKKYTGGDYAVNYQNGSLSLQYWGVGAWRNFLDTFIIPVGEWHHCAVVVNRHRVPFQSEVGWFHNGAMTLYESSFFIVDGSTNDQVLQFGNDGGWTTALYPPRQYSGQIDEVRISNVDRHGVPEPTTMSLVAIGLAGLLFRRKK
jgi:hypothetical protein